MAALEILVQQAVSELSYVKLVKVNEFLNEKYLYEKYLISIQL